MGIRGAFYTEILYLRGHFCGCLCVHSRVHFREHFHERVRGSNFAVRVLCVFLALCHMLDGILKRSMTEMQTRL